MKSENSLKIRFVTSGKQNFIFYFKIFEYIFSILDFFKSIFNLRRYIKVGRKIDEQQIEINDLQLKRLREEDIARQQADIIPILSNYGGVSNLTITNQGCAIAKNIRIIGLDSLLYDVNTTLPCDLLPNEEIEITITY